MFIFLIDSAWIFIGGLPYDLSEGDIICVFSQYGEIVNLNLIRDKKTGKQKGFGFLCYEDQRSTVLAVDNLNGIKILGKTIRVDHVSDYKPPKDDDRYDDETRRIHAEGCAPKKQLPVEYIKRERDSSRRDIKDETRKIKSEPDARVKRESDKNNKTESSKKIKRDPEKEDKKAKSVSYFSLLLISYFFHFRYYYLKISLPEFNSVFRYKNEHK